MADSACVGSGNGPSGPLARLAAFLEQERPAGKHAPKFLLQGDAAAQDPAFLALMVTTSSPRLSFARRRSEHGLRDCLQVEDRAQLTMAYTEFLSQLQKNILMGGMG